MNINPRKLAVFWNFAVNLGQLSNCRRLSVGCVILTPELTEVLSIGYNGPPSGEPNTSCRETAGNCGCIHAEANALVKLNSVRNDLSLLTTTSPCEHCAGLIINSKKIKSVVYGTVYRDLTGIELLTRRGIILWRGVELCQE